MKFFRLTKSDWVIAQPDKGFKLTLDSILLANFPLLGKIKNIIEFGSGNGAVSLMLLLRKKGLNILAVEREKTAYQCLFETLKANKIKNITPIFSDFRDLTRRDFCFEADMIICNPPFFKKTERKKSRDLNKRCSRFEEFGNFNDYCKKAFEFLKHRGKFVFVHRTERLQEIIKILNDNKFSLKKLRFVHSFVDKRSEVFLGGALKYGGDGLRGLPPLIVYKQKNVYTDEVLSFY